ncbi:MAG: putative metallopeptidase [Myxococcaceae bacterium]
MTRRRPNLNAAVRALIRDIARRMPEFSHIKASRILVVAGEARRASRGTVKPLAFTGGRSTDKITGRRKPTVRIAGRRMLYSITLRPLFFRDSTPQDRVETVIHELFHISRDFDGTLDRARRHARMGRDFGRELRPLVRRYLKECPQVLRQAFSFDGEVLVQQWLERPTSTFLPELGRMHTVYTEEHLFAGPVQMITARPWTGKPQPPSIERA